MNILVICTPASIHDYKWLSYLAKNSTHNFFVTQEKANKHPSNDQVQQYQKHHIQLLPSLPNFSLIKFWQSIAAWIRIAKYIKQYHIHCIHVIFPTPHLFFALFTQKPLIVSTRGSDVLVVTKDLIENGGVKNKILHSFMRYLLKKTHYITCTSELQKKYLVQHFTSIKNPIQIVRTGIDIPFIQNIPELTPPLDQINIFCPRFFTPIYNILNLIHAIKLLPQSLQQNMTLQLVKGTAPNDNYTKEILYELDKVNFKYTIHTYFNPTELIQHYQKSHLVVMIPLSDGTPNSALESMLCKRPLIMSDLNYQSPLFENTCLLVDPENIPEIALKIESALQHYPQSLLNKAYQAVLTHGNQATEMRKILSLYKKLNT